MDADLISLAWEEKYWVASGIMQINDRSESRSYWIQPVANPVHVFVFECRWD